MLRDPSGTNNIAIVHVNGNPYNAWLGGEQASAVRPASRPYFNTILWNELRWF